MSTSNEGLIQSHTPATFLERGLAMPFTTPQLAGARLRPSSRTGTEFVVPNPSGGRGLYILNWAGVRQLCRPTVHDTLLHKRVSHLKVIDLGCIRLTARQLAAEGVAGKEATIAAAASIEADRKELALLNFLLLLTLMEQVEPVGLSISAGTEHTPELESRTRRIVIQVAAAIGRPVVQISQDLEALGALFVPVGLEAATPNARWPRLIARLEATAKSLAMWADQFPKDESAGLASSLSRSASVTAGCAASTLSATQDVTRDMRGLLQLWAGSAAEIVKQAGRTEWLLDGWERFCLLWETANQVSVQRAVLREIAQLVPMLPKEATEWSGEHGELETLEPVFRAARLNVAWRAGGASHGLIARNERLQGLIA